MCIKQASLLNELRSRLTAAGFPAIDFHIINTFNASGEYHKLKEVSHHIPVYQEKEGERIFEKFGAEKDHILVADRCNRLTYQVIMPWSILHYPYVKAAILSTYRDNPCGKCQAKNPAVSREEEIEEEIVAFNKTSIDTPEESDESLEIEDFNVNNSTLNLNASMDVENSTESILPPKDLVEAATVPFLFETTTEYFKYFEDDWNANKTNTTQNVTEESLEIPLSWSTTIDHVLLNSKNNFGNDIAHSVVEENGEVLKFRNGSESEIAIANSTAFVNETGAKPAVMNITNEILKVDSDVTHRSPAIDEILEIEWDENNYKKNMYWQKHKKYKKNRKDHLKKNENNNLPSTTPIPIRIIFRNSHDHVEDDSKSEYVVLKTNDPNYHGHLDGKSYVYKDDNKIAKESVEIKTMIPGRFDKDGNPEKAVTDIYSIPWYDEEEPIYYHEVNGIQGSSEEESKNKDTGNLDSDNSAGSTEKIEEKSTDQNMKNETDDKLVSHYSKLLYWVNYSI